MEAANMPLAPPPITHIRFLFLSLPPLLDALFNCNKEEENDLSEEEEEWIVKECAKNIFQWRGKEAIRVVNNATLILVSYNIYRSVCDGLHKNVSFDLFGRVGHHPSIALSIT
eukprot:9465420-Ditylum_brightwellii.AAC.1